MTTALKFTKVRAGEYIANAGRIHVEIDKATSVSYLDWVVTITLHHGEMSSVSGDFSVFGEIGEVIETPYINYAWTLREAKELAVAFVESKLAPVVAL